jgi:hypothetical protein
MPSCERISTQEHAEESIRSHHGVGADDESEHKQRSQSAIHESSAAGTGSTVRTRQVGHPTHKARNRQDKSSPEKFAYWAMPIRGAAYPG